MPRLLSLTGPMMGDSGGDIVSVLSVLSAWVGLRYCVLIVDMARGELELWIGVMREWRIGRRIVGGG